MTAKRISAPRPTSPVAAVLILCGFFGAIDPIFHLWYLFPAALLGLGLLWLRPERHLKAVLIGAVVLTAVMVPFGGLLRSGLIQLRSLLSLWLTERTAWLYDSYEAEGSILPAAALLALLTGVVTALCVRARWPQLILLALMLTLTAFDLLAPGWWLLPYAVGTVLLRAPGWRQAVTATVLAALPAALLLSVLPNVPAPVSLHRLCYETAENPLPEGRLSRLRPFRPTDEPALRVTMSRWQPLYLRGFTADSFDPEGWTATLPDPALRYTLQKTAFCDATQLAAAGAELTATLTVEPLGACSAQAYVPYGAAEAPWLDARDLPGRGEAESYTIELADVQTAYLVQAALTEGDYINAESAYRGWVYENCLRLSEEQRDALRVLDLGGEALTTTEIKQRVRGEVQRFLTYDEAADHRENDALRAIIHARRGCSVHYATLTALLLRAYGLPSRYVEGYVISQELPDGTTVTLTQQNAHAWAEYYLDGIGWLPFDTTPTYADALTYELPSDGSEGGEAEGWILPPPPQDTAPVQQENDPADRDGLHWGWLGQLWWLMPAVSALFLVLRTALLRFRLRRRRRSFRTEPPAVAVPACWHECAELYRRMARDFRSSAAEEARFSNHVLTEAHRTEALTALDKAGAEWKKQPLKKKLPAYLNGRA